MGLAFADCDFDEQRQELRCAGERQHLEPQVFDVLAHLIRHRDRVVTKIELLDEIWGSRYVSESALTSRIKTARQAVGDSGRRQAIIRTIHGRGYRFVAPVTEERSTTPEPGGPAPPVVQRSSTLVGRSAQLARLDAAFDAVTAGARRVVFVAGEAGVGKTALVDAFIERLEDADVLVGRGQCLEQRARAEPFLCAFDALGRLCRHPHGGTVALDVLRAAAPTWLWQMPSLISVEELHDLQIRSLGATQERMLRELADALAGLATDRPVVLVLEDLHWADDGTGDVLEWLARRPDAGRLLVVGTYRADAVRAANRLHEVVRHVLAAGSAEEVRVDPLHEVDAGTLVDEWFPGVPPQACALVAKATGGVPLFMRDLVASWIDSGSLVVDDEGRWTMVGAIEDLAVLVPPSVHALVERELGRLDEEEVEVLEAAAVAGLEFSAGAVSVACGIGEEDAEQRCTALARRGLLLRPRDPVTWADGSVSAQFAFVHQLHHRALYERVPPQRCRRLHRAIGDRLERAYAGQSPEHVAELAFHFERGGDATRASDYLRRTAEQAIRRGAHRDAIVHLHSALDNAAGMSAGPERLRAALLAQIALATSLIATRGWADPDVEATYDRALELCRQLGEPPELHVVLYGLATLHELRGRYRQSQGLLEQQLAAGPVGLEIETFELLACSTFHQGAFDETVDHARRGLDLYRDEVHSALLARYGEHPGANCHAWAALALWFLGRPAESLVHINQSLMIGRDHPYGLATARAQAAILHQLREEPRQARDWAEAATALATEQGFPFRVAQGRILRGWAAVAMGEDGLQELEGGLAAYRATGAEMDWPYLLGLRADALLRQGRPGEALAQLEEALGLVTMTRAFFHEPELHRLRAAALIQHGGDACLEDARAAVGRGVEVAGNQRSLVARLPLVLTLHEIELRCGNPRGDIDRLAATVAELPADEEAPVVRRARAVVAGHSG